MRMTKKLSTKHAQSRPQPTTTPDEGASYLGCYSESHGSGCGGGVTEDEELSLLCKLAND